MPKVKRWTHWSPQEISTLHRLIGSGATYREAGRQIGRTHAAVKYKCDTLGLEVCVAPAWPDADKERLRELIEAGLGHREVAAVLGRSYFSVKVQAYSQGLRTSTRVWTDQQTADLRNLYGTMPARQLAARIGKPLSALYHRAGELGLCRDRPTPFSEGELRTIRQMNADGQPDSHIADALGRDRHETSKWRKKLGLPSRARGQVWKSNIAKGVRRQLDRLGLRSLADLRGESYRAFARRYNLPDSLGPRAVQIILALAQHGPLTRNELKAATGFDPVKLDNATGTTYLSALKRLGLIAYVFRKEGARRRPGHYVLTAAALDRLAAADRKEPVRGIA